MQDETVKAYARAFAVVEKAILKVDPKFNTTKIMQKSMGYPIMGFTDILSKATLMHALTPRDNELIGAFLYDVEPDDVSSDKQHIGVVQQGKWLITYNHWQEVYTPTQAAEALGITTPRITALIKAGKLEAIKVGKYVYIAGASVHLRQASGQIAADMG